MTSRCSLFAGTELSETITKRYERMGPAGSKIVPVIERYERIVPPAARQSPS